MLLRFISPRHDTSRVLPHALAVQCARGMIAIVLFAGCSDTERDTWPRDPFDPTKVSAMVRSDSGVLIDIAVDPSTCFACGPEFASLRYLAAHESRVRLGFTRAPDRTETTILRQIGLDDLQVLPNTRMPGAPEQVHVTVRHLAGPPSVFVLKTPSFEWSGFVDSLRAILDPAVQPAVGAVPRS